MQHEAPRLGDLFSTCEALPAAVRLRLAALLVVPGRSPALLPADLAVSPLPAGVDEMDAVRRTVVEGLVPATLAQLDGARLGGVVPALRRRGGVIDAASCPARLRALLDRQQVRTWAALGGCTVGEVAGWPGVGPSTTAAVVALAVGVGASALADRAPSHASTPRPTPAQVGDDLAVLLHHEHRTGDDALRRAIERAATAEHPLTVRRAAERLLAVATTGPAHPALAALDAVLAAAGDGRDRGVFERCRLPLVGEAPLAELAAALAVTPERVRQLRARAEDRVRSAAAEHQTTVGGTVAAIAERLGRAAPLRAVDPALAAEGLPPSSDSRSRLVLWLAGPYRPVVDRPGWVATEQAELVTETGRLLGEDGGVRLAEQVRKELLALGLAEAHVGAWLAGSPARLLDGLLVATTGASLDVAERALFAAGRSMTVEELAAWAPPGQQGLGARLRRDRRFTRVGPDQVELAEWGGVPYDDDGPGEGRCWLRVEVDEAVLAGSAAPVPVDLVEALGLRRGARRTFATRYGPVALSYDGPPCRGSLRPVVLAAGAAIGDAVLLGFDPDGGGAVVELSPQAPAVP